MRIALLIVFSYQDSEQDSIRWRLPGIEVDLYQCYRFVKKMKADKIILITDITNNFSVSSVSSTISKGIVDANIISLIDELRKHEDYWIYNYKTGMIKKIKEVIKDATELFIYYTGHGYQNNFVLPKYIKNVTYYDDDLLNPDLYDSNQFMTDIINSLDSSLNNINTEIFMIIDCCQISNMRLPFQLSSNIYKFINDLNNIYTHHKIICLTSSLLDENSIIINHGSVFSRSIYRLFEKINIKNINNTDNRKISKIINDLTNYSRIINIHVSKLYESTDCDNVKLASANIYSSRPNLNLVWSWIFGINDYFFIEFDQITSSIRLKILS